MGLLPIEIAAAIYSDFKIRWRCRRQSILSHWLLVPEEEEELSGWHHIHHQSTIVSPKPKFRCRSGEKCHGIAMAIMVDWVGWLAGWVGVACLCRPKFEREKKMMMARILMSP
jgi:hypothetical protein